MSWHGLILLAFHVGLAIAGSAHSGACLNGAPTRDCQQQASGDETGVLDESSGLTDQGTDTDSIGFFQRNVLAGTARDMAVAISPRGTVNKTWNNHLEAFLEQDLNKIMEDYTEASEVRVFDNNRHPNVIVFEGLTEIEGMFKSLFTDLKDINPDEDLEAPVAEVDEAGLQVFLIWKVPSRGYLTATDTFIFKEDGKGVMKIDRQNIVVTKQVTVLTAWNNHLSAFLAQDLASIMEDYDQKSEVRVFDNTGSISSTHKGKEAIRVFFKELFAELEGHLEKLVVPVLNVDEEGCQVFLVWKCRDAGYDTATDTFIFKEVKNGDMKISRQNIVVTKSNRSGYSASGGGPNSGP